jgi:hypothetical protein
LGFTLEPYREEVDFLLSLNSLYILYHIFSEKSIKLFLLFSPFHERFSIHQAFFFIGKPIKDIVGIQASGANPLHALGCVNSECITGIFSLIVRRECHIPFTAIAELRFIKQHINSLSAPARDFNLASLFKT